MAMIDINWNPDRRQLRQFSAGLLVASLVAGGLLWWQFGPNPVSRGLWIGGPLAALLGLAWPRAVRPLYVVLTLLAFPIGIVLGTVLLAAVFYGMITPIGLVFRLRGRDALNRKLDRQAASYWVPRRKETPPERYFQQF